MNEEPTIPRLMPLKQVVQFVTGEARPGDQQEIQRAVRKFHNRLSNGSVPRSLFVKIGKSLFLDIDRFEKWIAEGGSEKRGA